MFLTGKQDTIGATALRLRAKATVLALAVLSMWGTSAFALVRYGDFGAKGDGKTDDLDAIASAHEHANTHGLAVRADDNATYYIGGGNKTVVVQTNTDFGSARFIIDDRSVTNRQANIFAVRSALKPIGVKGVRSLTLGQQKIDVSLPQRSLVIAYNSRVRRFIRYGRNRNSGSAQTDVFVVARDGRVDQNTPIIWNFDPVTRITAYPIDDKRLNVTGGRFTTIANAAESNYGYYARGIAIQRSNVVVDGLEHRVTGEGDHGAPYGGFISISQCADVTVQNTILTGHKTYRTVGRAGKPVSMGTYDITVTRAVNVAFVNCRQANDIKDGRFWGIMGSNFCKDLRYERCTLSRFDAHQGVLNATIKDCVLGHAGINLIGGGTFVLENSTTYGRSLVNLRPDYGSTWQGEIVIRNCTFVPACGRPITASLVSGSYSGQHDFGYTCYMPERITIDTLHIDDSNQTGNYRGPAIFANFNRRFSDSSYTEEYPYVKTREVILKDVTTASGKPLRLSDNPAMFTGVNVKSEDDE